VLTKCVKPIALMPSVLRDISDYTPVGASVVAIQEGSVMSTVTVPRADITSQEVSEALRTRSRASVPHTAGMKAIWGLRESRPDDPDSIVVGTGSNRVWKTQVRIDRQGGVTHIRVNSTGPSVLWLANSLGITRKVHHVLAAAPGLGAAAIRNTWLPASRGLFLQTISAAPPWPEVS
jgi:hypothetical protein